MWWPVAIAMAAELRVIASGGYVAYVVVGRRGAAPGEVVAFSLDFEGNEAMGPAPNHTSHFATAGTDLLYIDAALARVAATGSGDVVSAGTLEQLSPRFGVCESVLHLSGLPAHCKRGATGAGSCDLKAGTCGVMLHTTQHTGVCGGSASFGDLTVTLPCGDTDVAGHPVEAVIAGTPRLSVHQLQASWEYDRDVGVLTVWLPTPPDAAWDGMAATAALTVFLALWQSWIRRLHSLDGDCAATERVWSTLTWYAVAVADVLLFAVATKVSGLVLQSRAFLPEAAGRVLGDLLFAYNYLYVGATCVAATFAAGILWLMWLSRPNEGARVGGHVKAMVARVCAPPARESRVITLRWLVDTIALTTLHISVPEALGAPLMASLGLVCGLAVAVVTGRDAALLLRTATVLQGVLIGAMAVFAVNHVALFMVSESFSQLRTAGQPLPQLLSFLMAVQAAGAGAVWSRRGQPAMRRGPAGQSAAARRRPP